MANDIINAFDLVIFGGTGDLAQRKLIPSLYHLYTENNLPAQGRILVSARKTLSTDDYIALVEKSAKTFIESKDFNQTQWNEFIKHLQYIRLDALDSTTFAELATVLNEFPNRERVFYLSTTPNLFGDICDNLAKVQAITPQARVVVEKPLGRDLTSSNQINEHMGKYFQESAIFRIDHYLGKEAVQNLLVLRFGNTLFESLWNNKYIDHVQITIAEQLGVEERGSFYEDIGALRDMLQNHLLQLLCMTAMEPPASLDAEQVSNEKVKVIRSLKPITSADLKTKVVRGQYTAGRIEGVPVPGYLEEEGVNKNSRTETFVALKAEVDNWRWAGVPFYLRTGKRMSKKLAEIVVQFKSIPHSIFETSEPNLPANKLIIRLQPEESIHLGMFGKEIGQGMQIRPMSLDLNQNDAYNLHVPKAYERLLVDAIAGRATLFNRRDVVDAAWNWVEPILQRWAKSNERPLSYPAGTWGPAASTLLLAREDRLWHEDMG